MTRLIAVASLALFALTALPAQSAGPAAAPERSYVKQSFSTRGECYRYYGCLVPDAPYPFCPTPEPFEICEQYPA